MMSLEIYLDTVTTGKQEGAEYQISTHQDKIYYMYIQATSTGDPNGVAADKSDLHDDWETLIDEYSERSSTPEGLRKVKFHGGIFMAWSASEKEFLRGAVSGMMIAVVFSFTIFLISTQNIIQAATSVLSVVFIVTTVVSIMVFQGWQLGISESIGVVILIGFSVDYVVHLSSHYIHSGCKQRANRM